MRVKHPRDESSIRQHQSTWSITTSKASTCTILAKRRNQIINAIKCFEIWSIDTTLRTYMDPAFCYMAEQSLVW